METPDLMTANVPQLDSEQSNTSGTVPITIPSSEKEDFLELQEQAMANFRKPNVPKINVPEKIIICLDVCYDNPKSLYCLGDGTTFTPINMMKRVLNFFLHSKSAINRKTEFAIVLLKATEPCWLHNFTSNLMDLVNTIDYVNPEDCESETFDFERLFQLIKEKVEIPEYKDGECILPPSYVVRMIVMYGRSSCIPIIPQDDEYFNFIKKQLYFYIDILLAHEDACAIYKCEEIYDALQDLDNGYSYVYEVSRNATKIHECIAKLLAHPLQRPLQKNTNYAFGTRH